MNAFARVAPLAAVFVPGSREQSPGEVHLVGSDCRHPLDSVLGIDASGSIKVISAQSGLARCVGAVVHEREARFA